MYNVSTKYSLKKFLVILIGAIILFFVIAFIMWDIQVVDESEAIGSYVADYDIPLDSFELRPDGKCIHVYQLEGSTITYDTTWWEYRLIKVEGLPPSSYIIFWKFSKVFNKSIDKPFAEGYISRVDIVKEIWKERYIFRRSYKIYMVLDNRGKYHFNKVS